MVEGAPFGKEECRPRVAGYISLEIPSVNRRYWSDDCKGLRSPWEISFRGFVEAA